MGNQSAETTWKKSRLYSLRRVFFLLFHQKVIRLLLWLIGIAVVIWAAGLFFVRPAARAAISGLCSDAAVYIESGRITGFSGIRLKGVIIAETAEALTDSPVFQFDEIDIRFNPWRLLRGKVEIDSIRLSDFLFNAVHKTPGEWNFYSLLRVDTDFQTPPENIPFIELENGAMRIARLTKQGISEITKISLNGRIAVETGKREYSFSLTTDGRFGFGGSRLEGVLAVGRPGEKNRFAVNGRIQMPHAAIFDNAWDIDGLQLECEFDKDQVTLKRCAFNLGPGSLDMTGVILKKADQPRQFDLAVNIEQVMLSDRYQRNAVVYSDPIVQFLDPRLRDFLMQYHPVGTGDLQLQIHGRLNDLGAADISGTIISRDICLCDDTFPYRLEHVKGTIELSGRDLSIQQVTAHHGPVDLQIEGWIKNMGPHREIDLRTTSSNMQFDEDLYNALKPSMQKVWYSFSPTGTAAVDYHFQRFADGGKDVTLTLEFKKAGLVYEHFPYPLENLTGTVVMMPNRVEFKDITAHYEDQRHVTLIGEMRDIQGAQPAFEIHVQAQRIPVDDLLINAMPARQRLFFDELELDAVADMDVNVFPNQTDRRAFDYIANIRLDGKRFVYEDFPLPMENVRITADVTHEVIRLHQFEAATAGGQVEISGLVTPRGIKSDEPGLCLDIDLNDFEFNENFWEAAGADAERILGKLRFTGRTNISGHVAINLSGNACTETNLLVQCAENPVFWDKTLLGRASGRIQVMDDDVHLSAFQLQGLELDTLPAGLLHGRLEEIFTGMDAEGQVDVHVKKASLTVSQGRLQALALDGGLHLENGTLGRTNSIHGLVGDIDGHLEYDLSQNTWQVLALCDIDHLSYRDWRVSGLQGQLIYDPNIRQFEGRNLSAAFYGGTLRGDIEVTAEQKDAVQYQLTFEAAGVDVSQMPGLSGQQTAGRLNQGIASGTLTLQGDLRDISQSQGAACVKVVDMQLGQQSTLGKVLTAMQFKKPKDYVFSEFGASARIRESLLTVDDVRMVGKPLVFRGNGVVDLNQKQIQMDWVAFDRFLGSEDTILDRLARGIGSAVWKVEVRGDLQDPQVKAVFLSVLTQPLDIFKKQEQ